MNSLVVINETLVFTVIIAAWVVYRLARNLILRQFNPAREVLLSLAFIYGCLVFKVTFFPIAISLYAFDPYDSNLVPLVRTLHLIQYGSLLTVMRNIVGNLVLLAPFGFFLPIFFRPVHRVWKMLGIGFLVSLGIELFQLVLKLRIFDVDDLIFNTISVLIGYLAFLLLSKVSFLHQLFDKVSSQPRRGQLSAFFAYSAFAMLAFLSIYTYQFTLQTQTERDILNAQPATQQSFLGAPKFGEFLILVSQTGQGDKSYAIYRRVFFKRYTIIQWGDLKLGENIYSVSGMSTGHAMNFFITARSQEKVSAMTLGTARYPVAQVGDYYFSYARLPLNPQDASFPILDSLALLDSQGNELGISKEK